jgi:aminoglycoside 6'-N-acetyltransferase
VVIVRLRPLDEANLAVFERAYATRDGSGEHQWFGFGPPGRGLAEMGALGPDGGRLTVTADDRVAGSAFWFRRTWGPVETSWCWEVALHVLAEQRRHGLGPQALNQLTGYLFDHTLAWRVQAIADAGNTASQRMLARCGFTRGACCAPRSGGRGAGTTRCSTRCCATTRCLRPARRQRPPRAAPPILRRRSR